MSKRDLRRKLIWYLFLIAAVIVINFFLPRLLPGSPLRVLGAQGVEGAAMTRIERERIFEAYNLHLPLYQQFGIYLRSLFTGDLGTSFSRRVPVITLLSAALPWTILLSVASTAVSLILGSLLGSVSVRLRRRGRDVPLILSVAFIGSLPAFWLGMVFIAVFGASLGILPMFGGYSMWGGYTGIGRIIDVLRHMIMPVMTLSIGSLMIFFTTMRAGLLSVLNEDYLKLAEARGLSRRRILFFYQWRNAVIPVFTVLMLHLGFIMSGSIVIEAVFSYPGLGLMLYQAVLYRDYPLMQYSFLLIALTVIIANLIADLAYPILDPRIRKS